MPPVAVRALWTHLRMKFAETQKMNPQAYKHTCLDPFTRGCKSGQVKYTSMDTIYKYVPGTYKSAPAQAPAHRVKFFLECQLHDLAIILASGACSPLQRYVLTRGGTGEHTTPYPPMPRLRRPLPAGERNVGCRTPSRNRRLRKENHCFKAAV